MDSIDTIIAISTPPGKGGVGIIRMSGPEALISSLYIFRFGHDLKTRKRIQANHMYFGWVVDPQDNQKLDCGYLVYFKAPDSYTGEDIVELQLHGSPKSLQNIMQLCLQKQTKQTLRPASPGEFTRRSFVNGRIDLSQAEAIADLIEAKTQAASRLSCRNLSGEFSKQIQSNRTKLLDLLTRIQGNINFPEDEIPAAGIMKITKTTHLVNNNVTQLITAARQGWLYREGLRVAIIGSPNVGKSSLFNALLARDRALVSDISGTTRDTIEETIDIQGIPVILTDTAGITKSEDMLEKMSVGRSKQAIQNADLLLLVLDSSKSNMTRDKFLKSIDLDLKEIIKNKPLITALNKVDRLKNRNSHPARDEIYTSIHLPKTLEKLKNKLMRKYLTTDLEQADPLLLNSRQLSLLEECQQSLQDSQKALELGFDLDTISLDIEAASDALSQILGIKTDMQMIDQIFDRFCIGK